MHQFTGLGGAATDDCDELIIDHHSSCQSQDNLAFMSAISGGSLSSGSSDCSLSIGNGTSVYDDPGDIITCNYSNYYDFNDCLQSDMLLTSHQPQYTNNSNNNNSNNNNNNASATGTTTMAEAATNNAAAAATTEKRSVLMNLLLDGSDIGAGYTSINCRALQQNASAAYSNMH